jgi:alkylation response protein AidB-like acyl-CoA dehydrogenase
MDSRPPNGVCGLIDDNLTIRDTRHVSSPLLAQPAAPPSPLEAARELAPLIRANADEIERNRELPRPLFEAIADAGMFHLAVPRAIGGSEIDFPTYVRVLEEIGGADASTGWAVNQGATYATMSARMAPHVAREIWIDTPRSVVANTPGPSAKAIVVDGGYRVSGRQPFSTGCRHASWIAAHATVIEDGEPRLKDGKPEALYLLVPVAQVELLDTWHTRGMRGTGTHHFEVKDVFVPAERTVRPSGAPILTGGARYKIPFTLSFAAGDAAVALGVARSALNALYELAGSKTPRYVQGLLRDQPIVQFSVGQSEAAVRACRAFLMEAVDDIWHEATSAAPVSLERRAALRLATTHAIRSAAQVVDSVYSAAGATAAFEGNLIQRLFQDIHVITQHVQGRLAHYELVGRYRLGLPIDETRL